MLSTRGPYCATVSQTIMRTITIAMAAISGTSLLLLIGFCFRLFPESTITRCISMSTTQMSCYQGKIHWQAEAKRTNSCGVRGVSLRYCSNAFNPRSILCDSIANNHENDHHRNGCHFRHLSSSLDWVLLSSVPRVNDHQVHFHEYYSNELLS